MKNNNDPRNLSILLAVLILTLISIIPVKAAYDVLDLTFGFNGAVYNNLQLDNPQLIRQPDGKILKFGHVNNQKYINRFNADGSTDSGFGSNGQAVLYNPAGTIYSVVLQSDGKILFDTFTGSATYISRVNSNGWYDSGFGTNGSVSVGSGNLRVKMSPYKPTSIAAVQSIAVLSYNSLQSLALIRRLNYNGTFSTSFGTAGSISVDGARNLLTITASTVQNSAVFLTGVQSDAKVFIKKYAGSGQPDTTFGTAGTAASYYGSNGGYWEGNFTSFFLKSGKFYLAIIGDFQFTSISFIGKHSSNGALENSRRCIFLSCLTPDYKIIGINPDNSILTDGGNTIRRFSADMTTILEESPFNYTMKDAVRQSDGKLLTIDDNNTIRRYLP